VDVNVTSRYAGGTQGGAGSPPSGYMIVHKNHYNIIVSGDAILSVEIVGNLWAVGTPLVELTVLLSIVAAGCCFLAPNDKSWARPSRQETLDVPMCTFLCVPMLDAREQFWQD